MNLLKDNFLKRFFYLEKFELNSVLNRLFLIFITSLWGSFSFSKIQIKHPIFRDTQPSFVLTPKTSKTSLFINLEASWMMRSENKTRQSQFDWTNLNLFSAYELSPFDITNLNIGIQGSFGSSGSLLYAISKWIPFPDYKWQPAIGLFSDVFVGFDSDKNPTAGSHIQLFIKKEFSHFRVKNFSPYFAPLLQFYFLPNWNYRLIGTVGVQWHFQKLAHINTNWLINIEAQYAKDNYGITLQGILFIQ